jgi:hypothetical protein
MAPLLAQLAASGLSLIANAVMAKGKAVVEEKLGVNLDVEMASENGRIRLMELQAEKEEALQAFVLAQRQQELEADKMAYGDTASAREMNARINDSAHASWLPKNVPAILALIIVLGGGFILATTKEPDVRTATVGLMTLVLGFYFGSSRGSERKDETIAALGHRQ